MESQINHNQPTIMHIDLNSCFAMAEQQANPFLRGKAIAVAAYATPNGCILSPSYEAKAHGIKVGMRVREAKLILKDIVILPPDPAKYRDIHIKFSKIFKQYSPSVTPKSIDEAVIDFGQTPAFKRGLTSVAREIKCRIKSQIGEWITCNIGISTNRFLAKLAASLHKPDGLDVITHQNLLTVYQDLQLIDLHGINTRYQARLNAAGIFTPIDFFHANIPKLKKQVFKSVCGTHWYYRLRGWQVDQIEFGRKSYGQSYSLKKQTSDPKELSSLLIKLCEKMGRRLRKSGHSAKGIHLSLLYKDRTFWHRSKTFSRNLYSTQELFQHSLYIFNSQPQKKTVANLSVACFHLIKSKSNQMQLFDLTSPNSRKLSDALDRVNDRYGEFTAIPALMMQMQNQIIDRISFGGVKELQEIY